jgi:hypothetical protein
MIHPRRKTILLIPLVLLLLSLSCALPFNNNSNSADLGSPDFPGSSSGEEDQNWQEDDYTGQSLFQPVMIDVLTEMAHAFDFPTPEINEILGAGEWHNSMRCGINDNGCISYTYSEYLFNDGTVGAAYFEYYFPLPGTACQEEIIVTVQHLSDTYLATLEYENFFGTHELVQVSDDFYDYLVYPLAVDTGFSYQTGYAWIYEDLIVDFMRSGTTMYGDCYGPEEDMPIDFLSIFYELLQIKGLAFSP